MQRDLRLVQSILSSDEAQEPYTKMFQVLFQAAQIHLCLEQVLQIRSQLSSDCNYRQVINSQALNRDVHGLLNVSIPIHQVTI